MEMEKSERRPNWTYRMGAGEILKVQEERDLGVVLQYNQQSESYK